MVVGAFTARSGRTCPEPCCSPPSPLLSFPLEPLILLKSLLSLHTGTGTVFANLALHKMRKTRSDVLGCGEGGGGRGAVLDP